MGYSPWGYKESDMTVGPKKIFEEIIVENFSNMGKGKSQPSPGSTDRPRKDEPKEEHAEQ